MTKHDPIRVELERLYNESVMMGRLRTGSPINHMVEGAIALITLERKAYVKKYIRQVEQSARIDEAERTYGYVLSVMKAPHGERLVQDGRERRLTELKKEQR